MIKANVSRDAALFYVVIEQKCTSLSKRIKLLLFCGHGFSRAARYFVLSDFASNPLDPWSQVVDLDGLAMGLRQVPPRTQWLFWDCCADIPSAILDALGPVGTPIIRPTGSRISSAAANYGPLVRFGITSSPIGEQAFGIPNAPSRFIEMLVEAIDSAGATKGRAASGGSTIAASSMRCRPTCGAIPRFPTLNFLRSSRPFPPMHPNAFAFGNCQAPPPHF